MRTLVLALSACGMLTLAVPAHAQSANAAAAEALFRDGQQLRKDGNFAEACPKLAESYRLDPATGSLLALALCYEGQGRLASAWSTYVDAASRADRENDSERAKAASERAAELEGRLSRLTIDVASEASAIEGLELLRDSVVLAGSTWSVTVPVDGGEHVIEARAPEHATWAETVSVGTERDTKTVKVPALVPLAKPAAAAPGAAPSSPPKSPPNTAVLAPPRGDENAKLLAPYQMLALGLGGAALVGIGVGTYFGLEALARKSDAEDAGCTANEVCPPGSGGVELVEDGRTAGKISTVAFIAGGTLLAGAAVVYFYGEAPASTGSGGSASSFWLSPGIGAIALDGRF